MTTTAPRIKSDRPIVGVAFDKLTALYSNEELSDQELIDIAELLFNFTPKAHPAARNTEQVLRIIHFHIVLCETFLARYRERLDEIDPALLEQLDDAYGHLSTTSTSITDKHDNDIDDDDYPN